jgi:hypothetical protein
MNFGGGDSVNVYAEAKSEYTRQLCQILGPAVQLYFIDLLKIAKEKDSDARRMLWNFQALLQEIPDWNQDKVLRETERIQRESSCDYLEELLTAVFIAHTKVLSAIRITTKQKKLQITIPKIDHFLHRTLRETGRLLWGNAFLFAEQGTPIDRQKNMRQVEGLIQEGIQQSIRSLLPVKTILREYLNDEAEGEDGEADEDGEDEKKLKGGATKEDDIEVKSTPVEESWSETKKEALASLPEPLEESKGSVAPLAPQAPQAQPETLNIPITSTSESKSVVTIIKQDMPPVKNEVFMPTAPAPQPLQTLVVDTEPSVSFTNMDTIFDSDHPEDNIISESPRQEEEVEIDHIEMMNVPPEPLDGFEDLEGPGDGIEFEEIA